MKLKLALSLLSLSCCLSLNAAAQENPRFFSDQSPSDARAASSTPRSVVAVPERMKQRFARGEAPFYVELRTSSQYLGSAYLTTRIDREGIMEAEAAATGVPIEDLEKLSNLLSKIQSMEEDAFKNLLIRECTIRSREVSLSNERAREMSARLDPSDAAGDAIAATILDEISGEFGEDVSEAVEKRISEWGETVTFTRTSTVDFAEITYAGDYQKFLQEKCDAIE